MAFQLGFSILMVATAILFRTISAADPTLTTITVGSQPTSVTTGSYTLCQFYSSIPGATGGASGTTSNLPACPSSILSFSYTDLPPTATLVTSTLQPTDGASYTLCQFYSSIPGATSGASTMTLPTCPSSLQTFTYTVPPTTAGAVTTAEPGATTSHSATGLLSTFAGMAVPTAAVDKIAIAGIGAFVAVAGML
jgi:hypothetical protein